MSGPQRSRRLPAVLALFALVALVVTGCTSDRDPSTASEEETRGGEEAQPAAGPDFGSLTDVCQDGDGGGATDQGVTEDAIQLGTLTDFGFTQNPEFIDAAEVFTEWCNDNGGINGREVTFATRDAELFQYRQRILEACDEDFLLVGGGAAFDSNGVEDRLECLLPEIPAQTVSPENTQSGLQVSPLPDNRETGPYEGYFRWLINEAYPDSADAVGIIAGDVGVTRLFSEREQETLEALGANVVYDDVYPAAGASDWTPYAQALKSEGVEGLVFLGDFKQLAKLEEALVTVGHELAWIDANTNAYNAEFIELAGDRARPVPELLGPADRPDRGRRRERGDPGAHRPGRAVQARRDDHRPVHPGLVGVAALRHRGQRVRGRAHPPLRVRQRPRPDGVGRRRAPRRLRPVRPDASQRVCFTVVQATPDGFELVEDYGANEGVFRCEEHEYVLEGDYGAAGHARGRGPHHRRPRVARGQVPHVRDHRHRPGGHLRGDRQRAGPDLHHHRASSTSPTARSG